MSRTVYVSAIPRVLQLRRWTEKSDKAERTATFWCENVRSPFTTRTIRASIYERSQTLQAARQRWSTGHQKTSATRTRNDRIHHPTISSRRLPRSTINRRCERFLIVSLRQRSRTRTSTTTTGWLTSVATPSIDNRQTGTARRSSLFSSRIRRSTGTTRWPQT